MYNIFLQFFVIYLIVFNERMYNDAVSVKFTNVICQSTNKSWVLIHKCQLRAVKRNRTDFNFNGTILHPVYDLKGRVQLVKKANGYKPWLIDVPFDVCEFMKRHNHPVIKLVYNIFKDKSNLNHTCPYVGPVLVDKLYLTPESMKLPMPTGEYGVIITWKFDRRPQAYTKLYFEYIEDL